MDCALATVWRLLLIVSHPKTASGFVLVQVSPVLPRLTDSRSSTVNAPFNPGKSQMPMAVVSSMQVAPAGVVRHVFAQSGQKVPATLGMDIFAGEFVDSFTAGMCAKEVKGGTLSKERRPSYVIYHEIIDVYHPHHLPSALYVLLFDCHFIDPHRQTHPHHRLHLPIPRATLSPPSYTPVAAR